MANALLMSSGQAETLDQRLNNEAHFSQGQFHIYTWRRQSKGM